MNIGIVGLGLIGGSLAKAIRKYTAHTVFGQDISPAVLEQAQSAGAICAPLHPDMLPQCDLVIVALYPADTIAYITEHASLLKPGAVVLDCCGVKRIVCAPLQKVAAAHGFTFIGGHPMAGTEHSGFSAAKETLFAGASMIITPAASTPSSAIDLIDTLCRQIGFAYLQFSTPEEHDFLISYTSQLAHIVSCAYVSSENAIRFKGFSAGSFMDMTRVARLNEAMWTELFMANDDYLATEVENLATRLLAYSKAIRSQDSDTLFALLKHAHACKELVDSKKVTPKRG